MQTAVAATIDNEESDFEVARRIAGGDRNALSALMKRHNQKLYRTARSILNDDAEAEDACQEAWVHAWHAMAGFRADAKLSTWLVRIVANEAIGRIRKRKRRAEVIWLSGDAKRDGEAPEGEDMREDPSGQPETAALHAQTRRLLESAIDRLPAAFRTVFVLRAVEDMSVEETAQCLGVPPPTVRTRYFRARALLREALAHDVELCVEEAYSFAGARCDRIIAGVLARLDEAAPPDR